MALLARQMRRASETFWSARHIARRTRPGWLLWIFVLLVGAPPAHAQQKLYGAQARAQYATALGEISRYMAQQRQLSGRFVQVNPSGDIFAGQFYLSRPGRLRFVYTVPNDMLIIADGKFVHIRETPGRPIESYPLTASPLGLFLHYDVDFRQSDALRAVEARAGQLHIYLRDPQQALPGELVLQFNYPIIRLTGWRVLDGQNKEIQIRLQDVRPEQALNDNLFSLR